ncbi:hypothetical protein ACSNO4_01195 [Kocuria flava]|uniref:hypothetical protein n=1 Tax=Kocuria flava TaxID=446860 RepID=UPI003F1A0A76
MTALVPSPCRPVAAVVTDGPEAVAVARRAGRIAAEEGRPLVLLVPVLRAAAEQDAVRTQQARRAAHREAEAVAARVRPVLEATGIPATTRAVWHRRCPFRRARQARAIALAHAAHAAGAAVVVTPAAVPLPTVRYGAGTVLVAGPEDRPLTVHRPAPPRGPDRL